MKNKAWVILAIILLSISCQSNTDLDNESAKEVDSIQLAIETKVNNILKRSDSLETVPSLRFAKGETETYTAKMYGKNQVTQRVREEHISNDFILGRDYFYDNNQLIFIKEEGSVFKNTNEVYTEKLIYISNGTSYKALKKDRYTEDDMFNDTLFSPFEMDLSAIDLEKPMRALQQKAEFAMYFDEFLFIDPQTYLIVENEDKSINAALYIIAGDSLINEIYTTPSNYEGKRLWLYHSFKETSGIERMIYEGAILLPSKSY